MGKKKPSGSPIPEMNEIFEGMQDLLTDENGKPLTPDHPQYKKLTGLMELMANNMNKEDSGNPEDEPNGNA